MKHATFGELIAGDVFDTGNGTPVRLVTRAVRRDEFDFGGFVHVKVRTITPVLGHSDSGEAYTQTVRDTARVRLYVSGVPTEVH